MRSTATSVTAWRSNGAARASGPMPRRTARRQSRCSRASSSDLTRLSGICIDGNVKDTALVQRSCLFSSAGAGRRFQQWRIIVEGLLQKGQWEVRRWQDGAPDVSIHGSDLADQSIGSHREQPQRQVRGRARGPTATINPVLRKWKKLSNKFSVLDVGSRGGAQVRRSLRRCCV